ncbi:FtsX-like permease family protein [candidate division KSB1 bacterium]|nr:FtsX-like permease family protein [candidate division KSB1 bacterium]
MIKFLLKGVLRDSHRSRFPLITVALGVFLTVLGHSWLTGVMGDMIDFNAKYATGHVKIMSRAYAENIDQRPNDLALMGVTSLIDSLKRVYPDMQWVQRIQFGGLVDIPDKNGETRSQGPAFGLAVDLLSKSSDEIDRLNMRKAVVRGHLPEKPGEILLSDTFAQKLEVEPGSQVTILSSTMYGSMAMQNFILAGTVQFGITAMDRGAAIIDLKDAQTMLDMRDTAGEILGYFDDGIYDGVRADSMARAFNAAYRANADEFAPVMRSLEQQNELASMIQYMETVKSVALFVFLLAMSLVLWNAGLLGGLRRYGEIGVRLAMGEAKGRIYRSMIVESFFIGLGGWILGTAIGLAAAYILQEKGISVGDNMKSASMMLPSVFRAHITPAAWIVGLIPGLLSTVLGTSLSGVGIYKRQTAHLFKELEA